MACSARLGQAFAAAFRFSTRPRKHALPGVEAAPLDAGPRPRRIASYKGASKLRNLDYARG